MTMTLSSRRRMTRRRGSNAYRPRQELESLESRIVLSFADGGGAVVRNVTELNDGSALVLTFDGPLDANPSDAAQSPMKTSNYSIEVPSGNAAVVTAGVSSIPINLASYNDSTNQVTLSLGSPLTAGQSYRLFINGVANTEGPAAPGLIDANQNPIDGDYDDTPSGDFYALFAWTAAGTPINFTDSQGDGVTLTLAGPGQLNAWRELDGDFNAGNLTGQADLTSGLVVQQLSVTNGEAGATTLSGSASFATGSDGVVVIPPSIAGAFTDALPSYFQPSAPVPAPPTPVAGTAKNLPFTIQIQPVNLPGLPALQSAVSAQDEVSGSPFQGDWLLFGGRDNGLHTFNPSDNFPPQDQNETVYVINPTTGLVWSETWSATDVPAGWLPPLYSTNQEFYQDGDTLYTVGGYGAEDQGGGNFAGYTTYDTLTALSVDGMINAVVNKGDVAALSQIQQIPYQPFKVTGGEMAMLNGLTYLVLGQDFEGEYNPATNAGFTQTYVDEIQAFTISYNGQVANSLSVLNYQAQNDQVNFRRRDYNLSNVVLPNGQQALEINGGVFTPGPGSLATAGNGYRDPILIRGIGDTQVLPYQQAFSQYTAPHVGLFDPSTGSMDTVFLGGISLYAVNFATGQISFPLFNGPPPVVILPFVNDVTTLVQRANGTTQEFEMPGQLPGLLGSEASFFPVAGLSQFADGVFNLDQLPAQPTTLGMMYGGIVSTVGLTGNQAIQTMATNAVYRIVLVPNVGRATNATLVGSLYQVLLGRYPTVAEQNSWVKTLNAGVPASRVALAIINSTEHRTLELDYFYNEYLNAQLDPVSQQFYLNEYAHGATDQQVIAQIFNSPQFRQLPNGNGQTGNSVIVTGVYLDLLDRAPTVSEEANALAALNAGTPLLKVIRAIMNSREYLTDEIDADYTIYLARPATAGNALRGIRVLRHRSSERFVASLMGSGVYFVNHPGSTGQKKAIRASAGLYDRRQMTPSTAAAIPNR